METIKGTIESISIQNGMGKTGKPFERFLYVIDGKKYSSFDKQIYDQGFKVGDYVAMDGERNGLFFNMKTMTKSDKSETPTNTSVSVPIQDKSDQIVDLLRQILGELKSLDVDRTVWTTTNNNDDD